MDLFSVIGCAFGIIGLICGLHGMSSAQRLNRLEKRLKELHVIDTEFNSSSP
ncbi:hypothetical protein Mal48_34440 [Thalassoglobus polymorphus]|uniref:Uncharacterized protein n=2 Tax=Thalassoglobus polymorphus TaxID=2527994 RepID=A0A517QRC7_9PLAN|nr:hypothetical protein Mal48_34440 [Thalassoglobus polymorphus]